MLILIMEQRSTSALIRGKNTCQYFEKSVIIYMYNHNWALSQVLADKIPMKLVNCFKHQS